MKSYLQIEITRKGTHINCSLITCNTLEFRLDGTKINGENEASVRSTNYMQAARALVLMFYGDAVHTADSKV